MHPVYANMGTHHLRGHVGARGERPARSTSARAFPTGAGPRRCSGGAASALLEKSNQYPPMSGSDRAAPGRRRPIMRKHQGLNSRRRGSDRHLGRDRSAGGGDIRAGSARRRSDLLPADLRRLCAADRSARAACRASCGWNPPHWRIDKTALEAAVTSRTRLILLNQSAQSHRDHVERGGAGDARRLPA